LRLKQDSHFISITQNLQAHKQLVKAKKMQMVAERKQQVINPSLRIM